MLTLTLKLPKKVEEELKKKLEYLETITKSSSGSHIAEALIKHIDNMEKGSLGQKNHEVELTIELPQEWVDHLIHLEKTTQKTKDDYIKEALFRYLEEEN